MGANIYLSSLSVIYYNYHFKRQRHDQDYYPLLRANVIRTMSFFARLCEHGRASRWPAVFFYRGFGQLTLLFRWECGQSQREKRIRYERCAITCLPFMGSLVASFDVQYFMLFFNVQDRNSFVETIEVTWYYMHHPKKLFTIQRKFGGQKNDVGDNRINVWPGGDSASCRSFFLSVMKLWRNFLLFGTFIGVYIRVLRFFW